MPPSPERPPSTEPSRPSKALIYVAAPGIVFLLLGASVVIWQFLQTRATSASLSPSLVIAAILLAALACALLVAGFLVARSPSAMDGQAGARESGAPDAHAASAGAESREVQARHEERRVRRAVLADVIESIPEAVFVAERDPVLHLRIRTLNRAAADLAGVPAADLVGEPLASVIHDDSGTRKLIQQIAERGRIAGRDARLVTAAGDVRDVRLSIVPLDPGGDDHAAADAWVIVATNLGESRREERRRIAASRVTELVQAADTPLELFRGVESVLRGAMHVDAIHLAGVEQATGSLSVSYCSDPRAPGLSMQEVTDGLSGYVLKRDAAVILSAEQIRHLVERGEAKAAEPVPEHWACAPFRVGTDVRGVLVVQNRDSRYAYHSSDVELLAFTAGQITAWFARRAVEEERKRLSAAVEQAVDAVLILDAQGRVEYANPAFEKQSGYTRADAVGRPLDELWKPTEQDAPLDAIWQIVRSGRPWSGATSCTRKGGEPFPVEATLSAVLDADGRVTEHVVVQHDVSHETELEEQLRQAQKMEAVGILAGGVAHDFNNLLSVIQGYGELARSTIQDEDTISWIEQVLAAARRASNLVGQLLAFSRRQVIKPQPLDLAAVVRDVEKMIDRLIGEDIELEIVETPELDLIEADPHKVEQVLMNLAVNARDAMPRGGKLTIRTYKEHLDAEQAAALPGLEAGMHVVLSVSDTGVGMPPDVRKRIFEPFYTTKPKGQGTGLGLSTVYGIVKQAGGHVEVLSEERRGTEFRIYLPSIGRAQTLPSPDQTGPITMTGVETVFVVEDEAALRGFVARILARHGYSVLEAGNGAQAVEVARAHEGAIDLLLADVVMPGMNGSSLASTLGEERPQMAVLFMSGYPDSSIASYGVLDPDVDLLLKPFTSAQLLKRVRRALDTKRRSLDNSRRRLIPLI